MAPEDLADLNRAVGAWIPQLRVMPVNAGHAPLLDLDDRSYEAMLARAAWHEWGHALSLARATPDAVAAGEWLLALAPAGIAQFIPRRTRRRGGRPLGNGEFQSSRP